MTSDLKSVSMMGRVAYMIMCVESYLVNKYSERDWSILSGILWLATEINWGAWTDLYVGYIPSVFFDYDGYSDNLPEILSFETYQLLSDLYSGLTDGSVEGDDPSDEFNYMLNLPFELVMIYEGTVIGDGHESLEIVAEAENILKKNGITLPDYRKVLFSSASEFYGWGNRFNGRYLSIILPNTQEIIIETDQTEYTITLMRHLSWNQSASHAVSWTADEYGEMAFECGEAEEYLANGGCIVSSKAPVVRSAAWELQAAGVAFTIMPAFPYRI